MDKIKTEIDLLRDSLRNLFVIMFSLISAIIGLIYKILFDFNYIDIGMIVIGIIAFYLLAKLRLKINKEINQKLKGLR